MRSRFQNKSSPANGNSKKDGDNDGDDDDQNKNKKRKKNDESPSNFCCDICGRGANCPRYKECEVRVLTDMESGIILYSRNCGAKILCFKHYKSCIQSFLSKHKDCCNLFRKHKKPVRSYLTEVSIQLAKDTSNFTTYNIVPSTKICTRVCLPLLEGAIDAGKLQETFPPEHEVDISLEKDVQGDYSPPKDPKDEVDACFNSVGLVPPEKNNQSVEYICKKLKELNSAIVKRIDPEGKFNYT